MKGLLSDSLFKVIFRNTAFLASGKLIAGVAGWGMLLCETHGLSSGAFGVLILITSYIEVFRALGRFQGWQIILHYAAIPWKNGDRRSVVDTIRFAIGLDLVSGLATMVVAMAVVMLFGNLLGVRPEHRSLVMLCCTLLPGLCGSSNVGILRLFDRVGIMARQNAICALLRLATAFIAWCLDGNIVTFVLAWYAGRLLGQLYCAWQGWRVLKSFNMQEAFSFTWPWKYAHMPANIWSFAWMASLNVLLFSSWKPLSNLLVGSMFGNVLAGDYALALKVTDAVASPAKLLEKNYYPEIVKLDPRTLRPWKFTMRFCLLSGLLALVGMGVVYGFGPWLIRLFGHHYGLSAQLLVWMAPAIFFCSLPGPLDGILYTSGREKALMMIEASGVVSYLALLYGLSQFWGTFGIGLAYTLGRALTALLMVALALMVFWNRRNIILPHERRKS
ncbi:hypothetical protein E3E12_04120 [Formicincola oecophyllae]|uniref:Lipopolysaccharide biosynthesis protein n=1 Tax=Formicincola oecophyllae TaxID=2558361 RepID=A0A4Y6UAN8_9PROT|nr:polysaccharide biosynthesis C-terminal domain-containing protein [Formicincola oecophyllae]QDH13517.1 hypothetical protein E3E12_04120 [Formicincola oecophyllae]